MLSCLAMDVRCVENERVLAKLRVLASWTNRQAALALLERFFHTADERIAAMRAALANGDTQALTSAAHTLRGASSMLDADEGVAACLQLEAGEVAADRQQRVVDGLDRQLAAMRELVRAF